MNKRVFVFVISLSVTLFLIQLYFEKQRFIDYKERHRDSVVEARAVNEEHAEESLEFVTKILQISIDGVLKVCNSVEIADGAYIFLKNGDNDFLSSKLYDQEEREEFSKIVESDNFAIYALKREVVIKSLYVDDSVSMPVKVFWASEYDYDNVSFGEIVGGEVVFPKDIPGGDGVVFAFCDEEFIPVGIYIAEGIFKPFSNEESILPYISWKVVKDVNVSNKESFFSVENEFLQLVFSSRGGCIREINLPFNEVVKEVVVDKDIAKISLENSAFPLQREVQGNHVTSKGGYYPLIRRDILGVDGNRIVSNSWATNIVSLDYPEVSNYEYSVIEQDEKSIVFETVQHRRKIRKRYYLSSVADGSSVPYCFNLDIEVIGDVRGLWLTSGVPEVELISGRSNPEVKYATKKRGRRDVVDVKLSEEGKSLTNQSLNWMCNGNGFFGVMIDPLKGVCDGFKIQSLSAESAPSRLSILKDYKRFANDDFIGYQALLPLNFHHRKFSFRIFAGPFSESVLKTVDDMCGNTDYSECKSFFGFFSFISGPIAKLFVFLMRFFYSLSGSWTLAIVLLTVALKVMLFPLNNWSMRSMQKMKNISPKVSDLQKMYANNPKQAQLEIMNLYKKEKVNPFSGCLPMIIQLPFLFAMFDLLKSTVEFRGETFIAGWIDDLAAPDVLFSFGYPIFFFGENFHLLPIVLAVIMWFQQKFNSTSSDSKNLSDQQKQQKSIGNVMNVVFAIMFYHFPAGLNIYWISSMLLGIMQQLWIMRRFNNCISE